MNKEERTISPSQIKEAIDNLLDEKEQLQQENKQLQERIDKAIEYINQESAFLNDDEYELFNKKELLEILKGDSNE